MIKRPVIFYIDPSDIEKNTFGSGGQSVLRSFLKFSEDNLRFVGIGENKKTVGKWMTVTNDNRIINFFSVGYKKRLMRIPHGLRNLYFLLNLIKYMKRIFLKKEDVVIFTRTTLVLWFFTLITKKYKVCFYSPGLRFSDLFVRHKYFMPFIYLFKLIHAKALNQSKTVFAAASNREIEIFNKEMRKFGLKTSILKVPTFVNLGLFRPREKSELRKKYSIPFNLPVFIFIGRLAKVKGIDFLLQAFSVFIKNHGEARLIIVGEGEEKKYLLNLLKSLNLTNKVVFTGKQPPHVVAELISASDVGVIGSYFEGFSVAMIEEFVTGIPVVSTNVSGADEIIKSGINGFIVFQRDPYIFAEKMYEALGLKNVFEYNKKFVSYFNERVWVNYMLKKCLN